VVGAGGLHYPEPGVPDSGWRELPDRDAAPEGDAFYLTGKFREVDPPARLAYTFEWEEPDDNDQTLVELCFAISVSRPRSP
jgi:uncharacterized protein YndB with AHSA1/START domain